MLVVGKYNRSSNTKKSGVNNPFLLFQLTYNYLRPNFGNILSFDKVKTHKFALFKKMLNIWLVKRYFLKHHALKRGAV